MIRVNKMHVNILYQSAPLRPCDRLDGIYLVGACGTAKEVIEVGMAELYRFVG